MSQTTLDQHIDDAILEKRLRETLLQQRRSNDVGAKRARERAESAAKKPESTDLSETLDFQKLYVESLTAPLKRGRGKPKCGEVIAAVEGYYGLKSGTLTGSESRRHPYIHYKQLAMHLCRDLTGRSFPVISRAFKYRDHTSVIYGDRRGYKLRMEDIDFSSAYDAIRSRYNV